MLHSIKKTINEHIIKYYVFVLLVTLFYGLLFCISGFTNTPIPSFKDFLVLFFKWGAIVFATYGLISVISVNRYVFIALFPLLTMLCTILAFFSYTANVQLTPALIDLTFINDMATWMSVIDTWLVIVTVLSLLVSIMVAVYRFKKIKLSLKSGIINALIGILIIMTTNVWSSRMAGPVAERLPFNIFHSTIRYFQNNRASLEERNTFTTPPQSMGADSLTVVFVIGESFRADHFQLNGYPRETTPLLKKENCISLPHIYTEPCHTHESVPHILTRADSVHPERAYTEQSFITIFKQAGYRTSWISNQDKIDTYSYFMHECDTLIYVNSGKTTFVLDKWLDMDILPAYNNVLDEKDAKRLILIHTIGSHWYYPTHFHEETSKFKPNVKSKIIASNTSEELINSYDNTIVETDKFIYELIQRLKHSNAILIYLSDHGESLGEDGYYLHAGDRPELHYPACFVWCSDTYKATYPEKINALEANRLKRYRTDFLFHSIIGAASIETVYKDKTLDIFEKNHERAN